MKDNCQSQPWPSPPLCPMRQTYERQIRIKHPSNLTLKRRAQPRELLHSILRKWFQGDEMRRDKNIRAALSLFSKTGPPCRAQAERHVVLYQCWYYHCCSERQWGDWATLSSSVVESGRHFAEHHLRCLSWGPNVPLWGTTVRRVCVYKQVWTVLSCLTRELHGQIKKDLESTAIN